MPAVGATALILLLAACGRAGAGDATTSASPSASATTSASESASASASTVATPSPDPLGAFACDFPVTGTATVTRAQLVDVRVGTHAGYDRVVFEFEEGIPAFTLDRATPPLVEDASGRELDVAGNAFWALVMREASRVRMDGTPAFTDTDFTPNFPKLTELVEGGDFEAVSTWYFGLDSDSCIRVLRLDDPSRLVFDIQH